MLSDVATTTLPAPHARLAEVRAALSSDLADVQRALDAHASDGLAPATDAGKHLLCAGGKRVRPMLVLLSAAVFGRVPRAARDVAIACELVHLATLLHDDVIDDGDERRGAITARRVYGNAVSVLAGDLLLTHALERTHAAAPELSQSLIFTLRQLVDGEVVQLRGRAVLDPRPETYFRIVEQKTASLFAFAAGAGARLGGAPKNAERALRNFGEHVGVAFQLVDDALDFDGENTGKTLFSDVAEGKLTLPLLLAIERDASLGNVLAAVRAGDAVAADTLAARVRDSDACARTRKIAADRTDQALRALSDAPPGRVRDLLAAVGQELAARAA